MSVSPEKHRTPGATDPDHHLMSTPMSATGIVFNIQRFSIHDGPGIRTTVFLKGCSLGCFWCHNPEGRRMTRELQFFPERCTACMACVTACPQSAHEFIDGVHVFHRDRCETTGACVDTCYSGALRMNGEVMTVEQVMEEVLADKPFYDRSGGGLTLSGGEPSLNTAFALAILQQGKAHGIHTALETCGECPWEFLDQLLPHTDLIMMDLKHDAPAAHRDATGRSNERIMENARRLAATGKPLVFRTPVVPTVNDSREAIEAIASFIRSLIDERVREGSWNGNGYGITYELLAFHRLAADKYRSLGMDYRAGTIDPPSRGLMQELTACAEAVGVATTFR